VRSTLEALLCHYISLLTCQIERKEGSIICSFNSLSCGMNVWSTVVLIRLLSFQILCTFLWIDLFRLIFAFTLIPCGECFHSKTSHLYTYYHFRSENSNRLQYTHQFIPKIMYMPIVFRRFSKGNMICFGHPVGHTLSTFG